MAIIISTEGKNAKKIDKSDFAREDYLQKYIYENPESIPLYDIKEDVRLLILAREFPTNSGPIDALGVDKDGEIYLVETKLYKNADKRLVVAQVLDYGASLWRCHRGFDEFARTIDEEVNTKFGVSLNQKLKDFFGLDNEEVSSLIDNMRTNLKEGNFKFVVLMDKLHSRLKDLIVFINENSRFDIFAVELEFYKYNEYEIMIPKLFGAEVRKDIMASSASGIRRKWNEHTMLEDARHRLIDKHLKLFEKIYNFSKKHADHINYGTGSYATFSPIFNGVSSKSLFTLGADKRLSFNFEWIGKDNENSRDTFKNKLEKIGFEFSDDYKYTRPSVSVEEWGVRTDNFIKVIETLISS
jgi:hypothetical protein